MASSPPFAAHNTHPVYYAPPEPYTPPQGQQNMSYGTNGSMFAGYPHQNHQQQSIPTYSSGLCWSLSSALCGVTPSGSNNIAQIGQDAYNHAPNGSSLGPVHGSSYGYRPTIQQIGKDAFAAAPNGSRLGAMNQVGNGIHRPSFQEIAQSAKNAAPNGSWSAGYMNQYRQNQSQNQNQNQNGGGGGGFSEQQMHELYLAQMRLAHSVSYSGVPGVAYRG